MPRSEGSRARVSAGAPPCVFRYANPANPPLSAALRVARSCCVFPRAAGPERRPFDAIVTVVLTAVVGQVMHGGHENFQPLGHKLRTPRQLVERTGRLTRGSPRRLEGFRHVVDLGGEHRDRPAHTLLEVVE